MLDNQGEYQCLQRQTASHTVEATMIWKTGGGFTVLTKQLPTRQTVQKKVNPYA